MASWVVNLLSVGVVVVNYRVQRHVHFEFEGAEPFELKTDQYCDSVIQSKIHLKLFYSLI